MYQKRRQVGRFFNHIRYTFLKFPPKSVYNMRSLDLIHPSMLRRKIPSLRSGNSQRVYDNRVLHNRVLHNRVLHNRVLHNRVLHNRVPLYWDKDCMDLIGSLLLGVHSAFTFTWDPYFPREG